MHFWYATPPTVASQMGVPEGATVTSQLTVGPSQAHSPPRRSKYSDHVAGVPASSVANTRPISTPLTLTRQRSVLDGLG